MKIIVNYSYGGFDLSKQAEEWLRNRGFDVESVYDSPDFVNVDDYLRVHPLVIECVEELGKDASESYSNLEVEEIPDEATDWMITEYDGMETLYYVLNGKICS